LLFRQDLVRLGVVTDNSASDRILGRRERKKLATRHALSSAALQLAVERGLENVTIEDITARADVAPRTFSNYFASKYEAMCAFAADRARRIGASLLERPADEPLWEALINAVLQHYEGGDQAFGPELMAAIKLVVNLPAIRGEYLKIHSEMQDALAAAIAERTGVDPETDMYPQILAGAVTAASQVAVRHWFRADPPQPLRPMIELALRQLAAACSDQPSRPSGPRERHLGNPADDHRPCGDKAGSSLA
jgi:AcrR family transcriptional regulator